MDASKYGFWQFRPYKYELIERKGPLQTTEKVPCGQILARYLLAVFVASESMLKKRALILVLAQTLSRL